MGHPNPWTVKMTKPQRPRKRRRKSRDGLCCGFSTERKFVKRDIKEREVGYYFCVFFYIGKDNYLLKRKIE